MTIKRVIAIIKATFKEWGEDKVPLMAAALAYYTVFSLAPLLLIAILIAGAFFGEEAVRGEIVGQIQNLVGKQGAEAIQTMLQNTQKNEGQGVFATITGVFFLLLGASGVFGQLQDALNIIWGIKPKPGRNLKKFLQTRFLSFAMVFVIGFLLLVSLLLSAMLTAISLFLSHLLPALEVLAEPINFIISFGIITLLFASIYKFLPDAVIPWRHLWIGAIVTSLLFTIGKTLIGFYLGNSSFSSTYGAAGSIIVILVWIYYSAQILLTGAEFVQVYAKMTGNPIRPAKYAILDEPSHEP
jgi:membrane protein